MSVVWTYSTARENWMTVHVNLHTGEARVVDSAPRIGVPGQDDPGSQRTSDEEGRS